MDKDSDPVVEKPPYEEAFIIPLYLDLEYDIYDYGSFDIYAKTRYQATVKKILNGQIYIG